MSLIRKQWAVPLPPMYVRGGGTEAFVVKPKYDFECRLLVVPEPLAGNWALHSVTVGGRDLTEVRNLGFLIPSYLLNFTSGLPHPIYIEKGLAFQVELTNICAAGEYTHGFYLLGESLTDPRDQRCL